MLPSVKVKVEEVRIGDDPQFAEGHFVTAKSVKLQIGLWSLLRGNPQVSGIELLEPSVVLIKAQDNTWNWSTLKPLQSDERDSSQPPFDLLVREGRFTLIDRNVAPPAEKTYSGVNVALDDFSPRQVFDFVIGLTMPGERAGKLEIEGQAGPIDANDSARTPIDARVKMDQVEVASLESLFGVQSPRVGRLTADVEIKGRLAEGLTAGGEIKAEQFSLVEGVQPSSTPLEADFKLIATLEERAPGQSEISLKLDECEVGLGNTCVNITGQITRLPAQPAFDLRLKGDRMALDSLRVDNLGAKFGQSQVEGWLQVKNFDPPLANFDLRANQLNVAELQAALAGNSTKKPSSGSTNLRADGQIFAGQLILDTLTAADAQSRVALQNQILTLDPISLRLYGGSYQGAVRIDLSQSDTDVAVNGHFGGVDVNQFLSSGGSKSLIYGRADGALNVRGRGQGGDALAKSLVGIGNVAISDGKFASFDLMKQVEALGKLYNLPTGGAGTAFRSLKTNLRFDRGRMSTDALQLVMDDLQVTGEGAMQLGDAPTMDYGILARLSSALTRRVLPAKSSGGDANASGQLPVPIGGAFGSVVGNFFMEKDSIVMPLKISGPLGNPSFGLNTVALQQRAKDRLLESVQERLFKKPGEQQKDQQKEMMPADALKGVLDMFKKKDKKKP